MDRWVVKAGGEVGVCFVWGIDYASNCFILVLSFFAIFVDEKKSKNKKKYTISWLLLHGF